jgi:hypothetical protein
LALAASIFVSASLQANIVDARRYSSPTPSPSIISTATFGYATIGSYTDRTPIGDKDSCRYQAPKSGTLSSISMYIQTANAVVRFGVYSDLNGQPNQLLAQSGLVTTSGNSWTSAPISVPVVAGQNYWLTIVSNSLVNWNYDFGALAGNGREASTTLSANYGTFTSWGTAKYSIYATYSTSTSDPTPTPILTASPSPSPTSTPTQIPVTTASPTSTPNPTPTTKPTNAPTPTPTPDTPSPTPAATSKPSSTPTATPSSTATPKPTTTPTATPSPTLTPSPTASPTATPVWSNGAEISSLSQLGMSYYIDTNGGSSDSVTITNEMAHSGTRSFKLTDSSTRVELDLYPGSMIQNDFYISFWVYVPSTFKVGSYFTLFQLEGSILPNYEPIWAIMINPPNSNHIVLYGRDNNGNQLGNGGVQADSQMTLPRDQWVHIEYYTHIGTNGNIQAWMNGVQLWNVNCDTSGLKQSQMYFEPMIYGSSGTIYVDDMQLYNKNIRT